MRAAHKMTIAAIAVTCKRADNFFVASCLLRTSDSHVGYRLPGIRLLLRAPNRPPLCSVDGLLSADLDRRVHDKDKARRYMQITADASRLLPFLLGGEECEDEEVHGFVEKMLDPDAGLLAHRESEILASCSFALQVSWQRVALYKYVQARATR